MRKLHEQSEPTIKVSPAASAQKNNPRRASHTDPRSPRTELPKLRRASAPSSAPKGSPERQKLPPLRKPANSESPRSERPVPVQHKSTISPEAKKKIGTLKPLPQNASAARRAAAADTAPLKKVTAAPGGAAVRKTPIKKPAKKRSLPYSGASIAMFAGGGSAALLLIIYFIVFAVYNGKFLPNTIVNSINIGGMTAQEAQEALLSNAAMSDLTLVTAKEEAVVFHPQDFDAAYSLPENALDAPAAENHLVWIKKLFSSTEYTVEFDMNYSETKLLEMIRSHDWGSAKSENAYIQKTSSGSYEIVPETMGDRFDSMVLKDYVEQQLQVGSFRITMEDSGCYEPYLADVTAEDLTEKLDICNQFANFTITFDFSDRTKVIDGETIAEWADVNAAGDIVFNEAAIETFVEQMAAETDTYGYPLEFNATLDGLITIPWTDFSNYGWQIAQNSTKEQIIQLLANRESVTVEPIYTDWGSGYCRSGDGVGNTYIEVDISAQHVWVYSGGTLIMESDCVSGMESDSRWATHRGICQLLYMERDAQLTGETWDTTVSYWMPFNYNGEGLHDLGRWAYGGDIYMYNGSHGCVNLPWSFARDLYEFASPGMPVIVHD